MPICQHDIVKYFMWVLCVATSENLEIWKYLFAFTSLWSQPVTGDSQTNKQTNISTLRGFLNEISVVESWIFIGFIQWWINLVLYNCQASKLWAPFSSIYFPRVTVLLFYWLWRQEFGLIWSNMWKWGSGFLTVSSGNLFTSENLCMRWHDWFYVFQGGLVLDKLGMFWIKMEARWQNAVGKLA